MIKKIAISILLSCYFNLGAQSIQDTIEVSRKFKTVLIFKESISESIIGSDIGFSIDLPKEVGSRFNQRILKVYYEDLAREKENFTNLTVITESGDLFSFILKLSKNPKQLTWHIKSDMAQMNIENAHLENSTSKTKSPVTSNESLNNKINHSDSREDILSSTIEFPPTDSIPKIASPKLYVNNREEYYRLRSYYLQFDKARIARYFGKKDGMYLWLQGIYYNQNELYIQVRLENKKQVDFDVNFIKYFIQSSNRGVTNQKIEITKNNGLLYEFKKPKRVKGNTENYFVIVIKKITLDDNKELVIEIDEESGDRNFSLNIDKETVNDPIRF